MLLTKKSVKLSPTKFKKLKLQAFLRDDFTCQIESCLMPRIYGDTLDEGLHPHHIILKARLRLDILENILTVCFCCHRKLHDNLLNVSIDDLIDKYNMREYLK